MKQLPLVSVCMITYGHEQFIEKAINGVLIQECDFEIELIIVNDCSPDTTDEVIQQIIKDDSRATIINYIKHDKNIGMMPNFIFALEQCKGKYIALCEGDDYWTDPLKLKKQVGFLDSNKDYSMCTHVTNEINKIDDTAHLFPNIKEDTTKSIQDYIANNLTGTCSLLFVTEYLQPIPNWLSKIKFGDLGLMLLVFYRSNKKMMILMDCMSVYRVHLGGIHGSLKKDNISLIKAYKMHLDFFKTIDEELFFKKKYSKEVLKTKIKICFIIKGLYLKNDVLNFYKFKMKYVFLKMKYNILYIKK